MDETITITVMAVANGLGVLVWWSVLFAMFSIPTVIRLFVIQSALTSVWSSTGPVRIPSPPTATPGACCSPTPPRRQRPRQQV